MTICDVRYQGSDGSSYRCQRPAGHAHGCDATPLGSGYYCMLHRCSTEERMLHQEHRVTYGSTTAMDNAIRSGGDA